jgi:glyoxylase I family protein
MGLSFSHIGISCKDPIVLERYYSKYFGFQRARVIPLGEEQIVFLKAGDVYLELFQAHGDSPVGDADKDGPGYPAWRHIAFQVDDVDAKLAEMGADAKITQGPMSFDAFIPGWKTVWVSDPNGNIVEITEGYKDQDNPPALPSE